jgi:hypothetical protein
MTINVTCAISIVGQLSVLRNAVVDIFLTTVSRKRDRLGIRRSINEQFDNYPQCSLRAADPELFGEYQEYTDH